MSDVHTWNTAAANNNVAPPDGWPEGMDYRQVNNSARENMAAIARLYADINGTLTTAGAANARTLAVNNTYTAYKNGMIFLVKSHMTNTGPMTIAPSGLTAVSVVLQNGNMLAGGEWIQGRLYWILYDGSNGNFQFLPFSYGFQTFSALTWAADLTWNVAMAPNATVTLTGNTTLVLSNPADGGVYTLKITQNATGNHTMTWPSGWVWDGSFVDSIGSDPNSISVLTIREIDSTIYALVRKFG